ncbi:MAG: dTDP-glucose 4,6-dehydratase [Acidimicrobiia bacterium]
MSHDIGGPGKEGCDALKWLVTGGAGFIGANFVHYLVDEYPDDEIVVVDALTYAGHLTSLAGLADSPEGRVALVHADIADEAAMDRVMGAGVDVVAHFAAESHVDRSITDPGPFLRTNVVGTEVLLRLAVKHEVGRFHHISTDEVFGALDLDGGAFCETSAYAPRSPYAASKAAADHLVRAYGQTYGLPYSITNCSNNYGPYHLPEKAVPLFITNVLDGKRMPLYGDGRSVRDWLFVTDHCRAVDLVVRRGQPGVTYCVGGGAELDGIEVATAIADAAGVGGEPGEWMEFVADRPGHDRRYAIDATRIRTELGWAPGVDFAEGIARTVDWYRAHEAWWRPIKDRTAIITWGKTGQ